MRTTGLGDDQLVQHDAGDVVSVGDVDDHARAHARATRRAASASTSTAAWSAATRCSSRAAAAPTSRAATPRRCTTACRRWRAMPDDTIVYPGHRYSLPSSATIDGHPREQLRVQAEDGRRVDAVVRPADPLDPLACRPAGRGHHASGSAGEAEALELLGRRLDLARAPRAAARCISRSTGSPHPVLVLVGVEVDVVEVVLADGSPPLTQNGSASPARERLADHGHGAAGHAVEHTPGRRAAAARRCPSRGPASCSSGCSTCCSGKLSPSGARAYLRRPSVTCTQLPNTPPIAQSRTEVAAPRSSGTSECPCVR